MAELIVGTIVVNVIGWLILIGAAGFAALLRRMQ
jgi:hypothetical protein